MGKQDTCDGQKLGNFGDLEKSKERIVVHF